MPVYNLILLYSCFIYTLVTIYICVPSDGINVARELYMIKYVNVDAYNT